MCFAIRHSQQVVVAHQAGSNRIIVDDPVASVYQVVRIVPLNCFSV